VSLTTAKKLASSLDPAASAAYGGVLNTVAKLEIGAPAAVIALVDGFGYVEDAEVDVIVGGQAFLAMSYAYRALADIQQNPGMDRESVLCINLAHPEPYEPALEWVRSEMAGWAASAPVLQVQFGNNQTEITMPRVRQGFAGFQVLVQGAPRSLRQDRALNIGVAIEAVLAAGPNPPPGVMVGLGVQGVHIVNWRSVDFPPLLRNYHNTVQTRLEGTLASIMQWQNVRTFKKNGAMWQLLHKESAGVVTAPIKIGGGDLEFGWMMAGESTTFGIGDPFALLVPMSVNVKLVDYIRTAVKKKF